ncbi:MAG: hypothetical protein K2X72_12570 [Reyranella sp.]|nr:hypothetical protein [Reyranella sp.]
MIDYLFEPAPPGANIPGTVFRAWRSGDHSAAKFKIGTRVYFKRQDRWGLSFYGDDGDPSYDAALYPDLGAWAQLLDVTVRGEGKGRFTTLNTYDRAAFTFGFLQFAAHVPDGDFVRWFRAVLARPEAADYFPTLRLVGGRIAVATSDGTQPLESPASTSGLMAFLNPNGDRVDAEEIVNAARLIDWTRRQAETRALQVEGAASTFRALLKSAARRVPLDGESDAVCAVIADIRHQGRGGDDVWNLIRTALTAADKLEALLAIGADEYGERCQAVGEQVRRKLASGKLGAAVYRKNTADFQPAVAPLHALAPELEFEAAERTADETWIDFDQAPFPADEPPGNAVLIRIPPDFYPTKPFVVTLFLHGHEVEGCSQLGQIRQIPAQIDATTTNTVLLAPRFGPRSQPNRFTQAGALAAFIEEASRKVADVLTALGKSPHQVSKARDFLARQAPIAIVSFSGGCHPLKHLLDNDGDLAERICGVLLLDSIYSSPQPPQAVQSIASWMERASQRSWLVSLHSSARPGNDTLMDILQSRGIGFIRSNGDWSRDVLALQPGTAVFCPARGHCAIPTEGPPSQPVTAALDRLDERFAKASS